jgi:predicted ATPase
LLTESQTKVGNHDVTQQELEQHGEERITMPHNWIQSDSDSTEWQCKHCKWSIKIGDGRHPLEVEEIVKRRRHYDLAERIQESKATGFRVDLKWQDCTNTDVMIQNIKIDNFKSLANFSLPLAKFNCLIGLNGSGKTTLLQAFDFMSHIMTGQVKEWLRDRDWSVADLNCRMLKKQLITLEARLSLPSAQQVKWEASFNPKQMRCTAESVVADGRQVLKVTDGHMSIAGERAAQITFEYQGSVLSQLLGSVLDKSAVLPGLSSFFTNIKSLELLSPHLMRQRARDAVDIGVGGEKLSAFLHTLPADKLSALLNSLKGYYPHLAGVKTSAIKAGWKKLLINEDYSRGGIETEARHINDGMLRLMAILAQTWTDHRFLLFDEIENGINPELIERLVQQLLSSSQQVMVTTHSPMILNYLPDDIAKESVILLYKARDGVTRNIRYFDLPETARKLNVLGPGEVFVDTDLTALLQRLDQEGVQQ